MARTPATHERCVVFLADAWSVAEPNTPAYDAVEKAQVCGCGCGCVDVDVGVGVGVGAGMWVWVWVSVFVGVGVLKCVCMGVGVGVGVRVCVCVCVWVWNLLALVCFLAYACLETEPYACTLNLGRIVQNAYLVHVYAGDTYASLLHPCRFEEVALKRFPL